MDPVTHALLGAAAARPFFRENEGRRGMLLGAVAAVIPDIDILSRAITDPALPWEAHRHVTHALAFAPAGGLLAALPFLLVPAWRRSWKAMLAAATVAFATHGLLDACTSYGTHLLLPFSSERIAWDVIAIIDPLFSLALLAGVGWSAWRSRMMPAVLSLAIAAGYLGLGARQHATAMEALARTAEARGHTVARARAMPTPGNLVVWRALYVAGGRIHADAVRVPLLGDARVRAGDSVEVFRPGEPEDARASGDRRARIDDVVRRFDRFTDGFLARDPGQPDVLADMRYSVETAAFEPLWGIRVDAGADGDPVSWVDLVGDRRASLRRMWSDLLRDGR